MKKLLALVTAVLLMAVLVGCSQAHPHNHDHTSAPQSSETLITKEQAKAIALEHAKMTNRPIRDFEIELDRDHNEISYEIEFKSGGFEFEYDIHAETGKVLLANREASRPEID